MDPISLEGECLCGGVRYRVTGDPQVMYFCHCSRCRKETGSIHGANLFLRDGSLTWERGEALVRHFALPGTRKARNFCDTCGCPLPRVRGPVTVVPSGGVETPIAFQPTAHIWCDSAAPWEEKLAGLPRLPEAP